MNPAHVMVFAGAVLFIGGALRIYRGWQEMKEERERGPWIYRRYDGQ